MLLEEVINRLFPLRIVVHGRLEEETQPALRAVASGTGGKIHQQTEVETDGSGQDRVPAEEVDLDLHGIAKPAEDVDIVPRLLVVVARRVVVDAHLVVVVGVEVGLILRFQDGFQGREL